MHTRLCLFCIAPARAVSLVEKQERPWTMAAALAEEQEKPWATAAALVEELEKPWATPHSSWSLGAMTPQEKTVFYHLIAHFYRILW